MNTPTPTLEQILQERETYASSLLDNKKRFQRALSSMAASVGNTAETVKHVTGMAAMASYDAFKGMQSEGRREAIQKFYDAEFELMQEETTYLRAKKAFQDEQAQLRAMLANDNGGAQ